MTDLRLAFGRTREDAANTAQLRAALAAAAADLTRRRRERSLAARGVDPRAAVPAARVAELDAAIEAATTALDEVRERLREAEERLRRSVEELQEVSDPRTAIDGLDQGTPLLLMPLRIETRFMAKELWVRIYPDQWAVDGFEEQLSDSEVLGATRFWASLFRAGGDEGMRRAAWRTLVAASGSGRAGWIIEQFAPLNRADEPVRTAADEVILVVAGDLTLTTAEQATVASYWRDLWRAGADPDGSLEAGLRASLGDDRASAVIALPPQAFDERPAGVDPQTAVVTIAFCRLPAVPAEEARVSSWTQAARANVLPDRIVLLGFRAGKQVLEFLGRQIPPSLAVGPDPGAGPNEQFRIEDGELVVPEPLRWMVDFPAAVDVGLAMQVPLSGADQDGGFDRLFAIGIRAGAKPEEDQKDLQELLTHHHRSRAGMSIVAQGTPTNNTEDLPSGLDRLDDPELSYDRYLGTGPALVDEPSWAAKQDGQWLAECLGLDPAVFAAVAGADGRDQAEAQAMNRALWPATGGYFLESMLHPLLTDAQIEHTRRFFIDYVSGRGRLPVLRLGRQPYGIVPATALNRLRFGTGRAGEIRTIPDLNVLEALNTLLATAHADLAKQIAEVPHAHGGGDPHQRLLDVVALHPASVEFHQRYAESINDIFNRFRLDNLGPEFLSSWDALAQLLAGRQLLAHLGYPGSDSPDVLGKVFHTAQHKLKGPVVDDRPLSEQDPVRAYCDDGRNYLQWLVDTGRSSLEDLRQETGFTDKQEPTALLYVLLRHALLLSWWDAAIRIRLDAGLVDAAGMQAARREPDFVHVADSQQTESRWQMLYEGATAITGNPTLPLHVAVPGLLGQTPARHLSEVLEAVSMLAGLPTARLERLLAEHLDCVSHRLDAWRLALVTRRLLDLRKLRSRATKSKPQQGIHLGAYGWLHDVRPEPRKLERVQLPDELAPAFKAGPTLVRDSTNGGFVHAPSLNHAATAAILRSGFLANATPAHPDTMALNLSSERMRLAKGLLEGLRNGQTLGSLLGYRFERGLHDRHALAEVDSLIHPLRLAFPSPGDRDGRLVLDGLEFARHVQQPGNGSYPFGRPDLPVVTGAQRQAIDLEVERLLDVHDATADLVLAEGVHQAVLGNFDRVGATLDSVGRGGFPTEPAVLQTPETGIALTHRMAIQVRTGLDHLSSPISGLAMTPRANAEPGVNEFLASVLPPPADVVAQIRWSGPAGAGDRLVSQAQLGLQPIDLLYLLRLESQAALGELDQRILRLVIEDERLRPDAAVTVHFTERVADRTTFFELAPLVGQLRTLLTTSRPLRASDVVRSGEANSSADALTHADRARAAAVAGLLDSHHTTLDDLRTEIEDALTDPDANRAELLAGVDDVLERAGAALISAGRFGLPVGGWGQLTATRSALFADLLAAVAGLTERWQGRLARADAALARDAALPSTAGDGERVALLLLADRELRATPTRPVPTDATAYRSQIASQRTRFANRRAALEAVAGATTGLADALAQFDALLPVDDFDAEPFSIGPFQDRAIELHRDAATALAGVATEADTRATAAATQLAAHDLAAPGQPRVDALAAAVSAVLGPDALFVPEFDVPATQAQEWDAAVQWKRTGGLLAALPNRPFPVDDWLHGVARIRPVVRAFEQVMMLAGTLGRPEPELTPVQFPHTAEPWRALEWPSATPLTGERLLYTAHYPSAFDQTAPQAGLLIDEWVEVVPGESATTGIVFHYDSPDSEPPQAMLLVVPPDPKRGWAWDDLVAALHDTLDLAQLRALEPSAVAETTYAAFLPATISEATVRGLGISANLAVNNNLYAFLRTDHV
jgi:hypothetical protein